MQRYYMDQSHGMVDELGERKKERERGRKRGREWKVTSPLSACHVPTLTQSPYGGDVVPLCHRDEHTHTHRYICTCAHTLTHTHTHTHTLTQALLRHC